MTSTITTSTRTLPRTPGRPRPSGLSQPASTPNLNSLYSAHSASTSRLAPPSLARKGSLAALTQNSLASIPDASETYALNTLHENPEGSSNSRTAMPPLTPGRATAAGGRGDDIVVGDAVDVPGNMHGTVRFIGSVQGRKGTFAGVELSADFASRGKNSGDVDGIYYFTTSKPGAGIFLPLSKAAKRDASPMAGGSFPHTPASSGLKVASQNSTNFTPPTPSLPKFSQSLGPGRAPSPSGKRPRTSLPRPDSPVRRLQMTPGPKPSIPTPASKVPSRFGSPTANKFSQSVRGTAGDPSKRGLGPERKGSLGPRSASALGNSSNATDDETTPVGVNRTKTNGSFGSVSSFNNKIRPPSRTASRAHNHNDDEVERLRTQLEDRDKQLKEQAATLSEMESSLTELQTLIENPEGPAFRRGSIDDKGATELRAMVREKNEKIAMLTAEFDAHRADFRSTIDTLEMASTETERVYEKRIEELMQELNEAQERTSDVATVAQQLKQLESLVQELEEGLEDARRGEAEARGEVEFLRGEVERTRSELRREREKAQESMKGGGHMNGDRSSISKELEQKEDEIRGLKAIIHSLSRDSVPQDSPEKTPQPRQGPWKAHRRNESLGDRMMREKLEREVADLRALLDNKNNREEEMERELDQLRRGGSKAQRDSSMTLGSSNNNNNRSSLRDSRGTVVLARDYEARSPEAHHHNNHHHKTHSRGLTLDTMPESDAYSSVTETSTLWCEICETSGHDILTCTNMFGQDANGHEGGGDPARTGKDVVREGLKGLSAHVRQGSAAVPPLSPIKPRVVATPPKQQQASPAPAVPAEVRILPNPMDSGPVAGKESGVVDADKWCALCERDGHDSVDCPFEDAF
ncbi:uncharacterized protein E0L32_000621 [Thyridium curvatum]|uniref:CAP-Gly domain-containing protein n=1 Tax=Thyridium curvatum TaxID=1093900 RepID=A0A507B3A1_9PEZI|nr:uncharacterized protein E0L32_000621 [Thyridium curvatum]TPX14227.1 hypothetical protein E0L32_000621 [Thyridium curvatum]